MTSDIIYPYIRSLLHSVSHEEDTKHPFLASFGPSAFQLSSGVSGCPRSALVIDSRCLVDFIELFCDGLQGANQHDSTSAESTDETFLLLSGSLSPLESVLDVFFDLLQTHVLLPYKTLLVDLIWSPIDMERRLSLFSSSSPSSSSSFQNTVTQQSLWSLLIQSKVQQLREEYSEFNRLSLHLTPFSKEDSKPVGEKKKDPSPLGLTTDEMATVATLVRSHALLVDFNVRLNVERGVIAERLCYPNNHYRQHQYPFVGRFIQSEKGKVYYEYTDPCVVVWTSLHSLFIQAETGNHKITNDDDDNGVPGKGNKNPCGERHSLEYLFYSVTCNALDRIHNVSDGEPNISKGKNLSEFYNRIPNSAKICVNGPQWLLRCALTKQKSKSAENSKDSLLERYLLHATNQTSRTLGASHDTFQIISPGWFAQTIGLGVQQPSSKVLDYSRYLPLVFALLKTAEAFPAGGETTTTTTTVEGRVFWEKAVTLAMRYHGYLTDLLVSDWSEFLQSRVPPPASTPSMGRVLELVQRFYYLASGSSPLLRYGATPAYREDHTNTPSMDPFALLTESRLLYSRYYITPFLLTHRLTTLLAPFTPPSPNSITDTSGQWARGEEGGSAAKVKPLFTYLSSVLQRRTTSLLLGEAEVKKQHVTLLTFHSEATGSTGGGFLREKEISLNSYTPVAILNHFLAQVAEKEAREARTNRCEATKYLQITNVTVDYIKSNLNKPMQLPFLTLFLLYLLLHPKEGPDSPSLTSQSGDGQSATRPLTLGEVKKFYFFLCFCYSIRQKLRVVARAAGFDGAYSSEGELRSVIQKYLKPLLLPPPNPTTVSEGAMEVNQEKREEEEEGKGRRWEGNSAPRVPSLDSWLHPTLLTYFTPLLSYLTLLVLYYQPNGRGEARGDTEVDHATASNSLLPLDSYSFSLEGGLIGEEVLRMEAFFFGFCHSAGGGSEEKKEWNPTGSAAAVRSGDFIFSLLKSFPDWSKGCRYIEENLLLDSSEF